jgi:hypothetical protein
MSARRVPASRPSLKFGTHSTMRSDMKRNLRTEGGCRQAAKDLQG